MYVLIGMGEESQNIEIPCMFFDTREDAEIHLSGIPWLHRCENNGAAGGNGKEEPAMYVIPEGLYDKPVPLALLPVLPQKIVSRAAILHTEKWLERTFLHTITTRPNGSFITS
jgi:hypothetical protein